MPDTPITRQEQYLDVIAGGESNIPDKPITRVEQYLNKIATGNGDIPDKPITRVEQYLDEIAKNGNKTIVLVGEEVSVSGKKVIIANNGSGGSFPSDN